MKIAEVSAYPATTHSIAPAPACRSDCIDGSATLTMKKSRTTMNVPARTTGSGAHRPASSDARRTWGWSVCVLMPGTVADRLRHVDYLPGNALRPPPRTGAAAILTYRV